MSNVLLNKAKKAKSDEFYTQLVDIENELKHYKDQFYGKTVFCNCDNPYESNFFKYFAMNFKFLGLKKLITTCYKNSPIANTQLSLFDHENIDNKTTSVPHKIVITEVDDFNKDNRIDLADVEWLLQNGKNVLTRLKEDGDFRSQECIDLLKECDIVVTNPPFSLFREYVAQLMEYNKKFLIIGNINAIKYKEIFPLIKENKMWLGESLHGRKIEFRVPNYYDVKTKNYRIDENGRKYIRVPGNIRWFTNINIPILERKQSITLYKKYTLEEYPKYDNYDAIDVSKIADIPYDYDGAIGVPITFMDKYNPKQFKILDANDFLISKKNSVKKDVLINDGSVNGKIKYTRILIKRIGEAQ